VSEVRRRLGGAGYRSELIDGAIERLTELGMLNDETFARAWVESRDRARPRGERAIWEELRLKGIDRSTADLVLGERREAASATTDAEMADAPPRSADRNAADRLLAKHARALGRITDARQRRQRAYALLARNGFDPEVCGESAAATAELPLPDTAPD